MRKELLRAAAFVGGAGVLAYFLIRKEDDRLFRETFTELGFPRGQDDLKAWWKKARTRRLEGAEEGLQAIAALEKLSKHYDAADRLRKAFYNIRDPSCDPQVALWILCGALDDWMELFMLRPGARLDTSEFLDAVQALRAGASDEDIHVRIAVRKGAR